MKQDAGKPDGADHADLIAAVARNGDRLAFAALFSYFAPRIKAWLQRSLCDPALADELTQETMLLVWQKSRLYDPERAAPATWIYTIARNLRVDALRRERHPSMLLADLAELAQDTIQPEQDAIARQHAGRIRAALRALPADQAAVVDQVYFADKAQSEIRDALRIPLGTVKSRLRLAIGRLKSALGDLR